MAGYLAKSVDLMPFSIDTSWNGTGDEFALANGGGVGVSAHNSDDIIFGGQGSDFLRALAS